MNRPSQQLCTAALLAAALMLNSAAAISPPEMFQALLDEHEQAGDARRIAPKFIDLAKTHPRHEVAVDSLIWVVTNLRRGDELETAIQLIATDHLANAKLAAVCQTLVTRPSAASENLLRSLQKSSPHNEVKAHACLSLAAYLQKQAALLADLQGAPTQRRRIEQFYGKTFVDHLASLDPKELSQETEQLYETVAKAYADVQTSDGSLGDLAAKELFAIRHLVIGAVAPDIVGEDINGRQMKLSDYRGKVVMLDFWGNW